MPTIKGPIKIVENGKISEKLREYHPLAQVIKTNTKAKTKAPAKSKVEKKESIVDKVKNVFKRPRKRDIGGKHGRSN